jgi:hypothetical protein
MVPTSLHAPKFVPALLGGLFIGVLSSLPIVNLANCCCLWVIIGGVLAAYVMQANHPLPVTIGDGVIVGFLAGLVGGLCSFAISIPMNLYITPITSGMYEGFMRNSRQDLPPEARHMLRQVGPQGVQLIGALVFASISLVFATFGGLLGALYFKSPPLPPIPPGPPPPPAWLSPAAR